VFLVLYHVVGLGQVGVYERKKDIKFEKPSIVRGIVYSALSPLAIVVLLLVLFFVSQLISPMHDSM